MQVLCSDIHIWVGTLLIHHEQQRIFQSDPGIRHHYRLLRNKHYIFKVFHSLAWRYGVTFFLLSISVPIRGLICPPCPLVCTYSELKCVLRETLELQTISTNDVITPAVSGTGTGTGTVGPCSGTVWKVLHKTIQPIRPCLSPGPGDSQPNKP